MKASIGTVLRTVRHLRFPQAVAQLRHVLAPPPSGPGTSQGATPSLATHQASCPFLPPARHAHCSRTPEVTTLRLLNREVAFRDAVDWDFAQEGPLFAYQLHHFDHARCDALSPGDRVALILDWIEHHPAGVGWDPHPISHRVLAWGKLLLAPGALGLGQEELGPEELGPEGPGQEAQETIRRSLAAQLDALSRGIEHRLQANHLFTNLLALVFGGCLFAGPRADGWLASGDAFRAELRDQFHPDGAHEERSPMYHAVLLEQVLDLLNLARTVPARAPAGLVEELTDTASRMCGALEVWTRPDGEIALFGDAAFGIAPRPSELADYASVLNVPVLGPEQPDRLQWGGFARLRDGAFDAIVSLAGPSPDHQPGHSHCDALAFELSVGGERVVTDTGVFEYVPGRDRDLARATRSHATIEVAGEDQAELWAAHRVGGRPWVEVVDYAPGRSCEATCTGWSGKAVHRRRFELEDNVLLVHDSVEAAGSGTPFPARLTLPLAPGLAARLVGEAGAEREMRVRLPGAGELKVDLPGGDSVRWHLERTDSFPEMGRRVARWCLVGKSDSFRSGTWRFRLEPRP
jgi:hypothetical protein